MCVPIIAAFAGLALNAYGGYVQGKADQQAANYSAAVDRNNATLKDYQADMTAQVGAVEEDRARAKVRQMMGSQRAVLAANNLDLSDGGTPLDLVTDTAVQGAEDALNIRYNAMRDAWGLREQAKDLRSSAKYKQVAGANAKNATFLTTAGNTLMGGYTLYNEYSKSAAQAGAG